MVSTQTDLAHHGRAPESEVTTPVIGPESGLSVAQAAQRLAEDGPNALPGGQQRSLLSIAVETVREPMFSCCSRQEPCTSSSVTCRRA